jgi:hypothetical protein
LAPSSRNAYLPLRSAQAKQLHAKKTTVVFHIGFHKTGSTSLQQFFAENEAALRVQGIRFPSATRERNPRQIIHSNLPWQLLTHGKFDPALGSLKDIARQVQTEPPAVWIVTTEGLSRLTDASLIKCYFPDANIKTIAYCRNPLHAAPSLYTEHLKFGTTKTWSCWANSANLTEWFDYENKLAPWRSFGEVTLRHLTEDRTIEESGLSIFEDFVTLVPTVLETRDLNMSYLPKANSRLSLLECAALYAVNHALKRTAESIDEKKQTSLRNTARRVVRRVFTEFLHPFSLESSQQKQLHETLCRLHLVKGTGTPLDESGGKRNAATLAYASRRELALRKAFRRHFPSSLPVKVTKFLHFLKDASSPAAAETCTNPNN